jgi:hypothetical protein
VVRLVLPWVVRLVLLVLLVLLWVLPFGAICVFEPLSVGLLGCVS